VATKVAGEIIMENQNSTPQGKKNFFSTHGKKKKVIIAIIAVLILFGFIGRGIGSHGYWGNRGYLFMKTGNITFAAKDFESMGIVFTESAVTMRDGYRATYDTLMKEAAKKGADAIINVNIFPTKGIFNRTWSGSATAIKYLDAIPTEASNTSSLGVLGSRDLGRGWYWN
jgi:hypothetical protein